MVVNACVQYRKQIFIDVGDIHLDRQHFQINCQFEQTKMAISRPFFHGRIVVNACVQYPEEMFIGVVDIYPNGQHFQIFCQFEQIKMAISRPF